MKTSFTEWFTYALESNHRVLEILKTAPEDRIQESLRLLSHMSNAHHVWVSRIQGIPPVHGVWELQTVDYLPELERRNYDASLDILETRDLEEIISYKTTAGEPFTNRLQDILFHIINHGTYHRGQIAQELRRQGLEPVSTDYIFYKR